MRRFILIATFLILPPYQVLAKSDARIEISDLIETNAGNCRNVESCLLAISQFEQLKDIATEILPRLTELKERVAKLKIYENSKKEDDAKLLRNKLESIGEEFEELERLCYKRAQSRKKIDGVHFVSELKNLSQFNDMNMRKFVAYTIPGKSRIYFLNNNLFQHHPQYSFDATEDVISKDEISLAQKNDQSVEGFIEFHPSKMIKGEVLENVFVISIRGGYSNTGKELKELKDSFNNKFIETLKLFREKITIPNSNIILSANKNDRKLHKLLDENETQYILPEDNFGVVVPVENDSIAYRAGLATGKIKIIDEDDIKNANYDKDTILILDYIPKDFTPKDNAGVISKRPIPDLSHIHTRAKDSQAPVIYLKNIPKEIIDNIGKTVTLLVRSNGEIKVVENNSTPSRKTAKKVAIIPEANTKLKDIYFFNNNEVKRPSVNLYGVKGSNLAYLNHILRDNASPQGIFDNAFLLPFSIYQEHINTQLTQEVCQSATKKCSEQSPEICLKLEQMCQSKINQPIEHFIREIHRAGLILDPNALAFVRNIVKKTPLNRQTLASLKKLIKEKFPNARRIRFRSSTNAEDLIELSGAGIYDSESATLADEGLKKSDVSKSLSAYEKKRLEEQIKNSDDPKALKKKLYKKRTVEKAIKNVFASLWSDRASRYREHFGVDHFKVKMALAVHPSFVDEAGNGVIHISRGNKSGLYNLKIALKLADDNVTTTTSHNRIQVTELQHDKFHTGTTVISIKGEKFPSFPRALWPELRSHPSLQKHSVYDSVTNFSKKVPKTITVYQHMLKNIDDDLKDKVTLELEYKVTSWGEFVIKQARFIRN